MSDIYCVDYMAYDLNLLRVFDAVMDERNVTAAAKRLHLSQSAVSAAISRLRSLYDDELFTRARYGVTPTERARAIAPVISSALRELDRVTIAEVPFDPATASRTIRLTASGYFECVLVPELVAQVATQAPGVIVDVRPLAGDIGATELGSGRVDLALGRFVDPSENLVVTEILEDEYRCLIRREDARTKRRLSRRAFESMTHVVVSPPGRWRTGLFQPLEKAGLKRRVQLRVSHFLAVGPAILRNGGCATLPRRIASLFESDKRFVVLAPPVDLGTFPMQMSWHPRFRRDAGHAWLRGLIQTVSRTLV
ncbi:MAG: LysR family transcriptional regulator [Woeseiaceae bacterium]|nr:LysR family transcriptional regulator [Woeseiaceae bacterium]